MTYGARLQPALQWLIRKRTKDGSFLLEHARLGNVHFEREKVGEPSRLVTWKALFVLNAFGREDGSPDHLGLV